jgi:hypothetical protein
MTGIFIFAFKLDPGRRRLLNAKNRYRLQRGQGGTLVVEPICQRYPLRTIPSLSGYAVASSELAGDERGRGIAPCNWPVTRANLAVRFFAALSVSDSVCS